MSKLDRLMPKLSATEAEKKSGTFSDEEAEKASARVGMGFQEKLADGISGAEMFGKKSSPEYKNKALIDLLNNTQAIIKDIEGKSCLDILSVIQQLIVLVSAENVDDSEVELKKELSIKLDYLIDYIPRIVGKIDPNQLNSVIGKVYEIDEGINPSDEKNVNNREKLSRFLDLLMLNATNSATRQ